MTDSGRRRDRQQGTSPSVLQVRALGRPAHGAMAIHWHWPPRSLGPTGPTQPRAGARMPPSEASIARHLDRSVCTCVQVPGYHSFIRGLVENSTAGGGLSLPVSQLYNNFALGHVLVSDDAGDTFQLASAAGFGDVGLCPSVLFFCEAFACDCAGALGWSQ
jgi:hypothetical protein